MRTLDAARESWDELRQYSSLTELRQAVRLDGKSSVATSGGRSACWKAFLIFESIDSAEWLRTLSSSRSAYNSLKSHFMRHIENPDELAANYDPLSEAPDSAAASPWTQLRKDEELRAEIKQDVDRCMQENEFFRLPATQRIMLDVLFVYCRLNPDVSYRQGMHEILAPILWVVDSGAIDLGQSSKAMGEDALIKDVFDAAYIEHDAFTLFGQIMQSAKNFYEQTTLQGAENPIVSRSRKIFTELLPLVDSDLAQHLERVDIVPQVFLIRWIRLIFGREFRFDDLLSIWDVIFAEDPTLEIVDHVCLAMLLRMRWQLIEADYNSALTLLLKYPMEDDNKDIRAQSLALDALYLREHMDYHGGSYLVTKYSGKPLLHNERPATPPALQRNITTFAAANASKGTAASSRLPPTRSSRPPRGFESVLRSTAKNIYARGEELGIGKAVKGAVDEVHRRAQEIRDLQTPSPPTNVRYRAPQGSSGSSGGVARIKTLEERSKQLGQLLEGALAELWECQKQVAEGSGQPVEDTGKQGQTTNVEKLSLAIAKVQFVQVYLDDPSLPLPEEEQEDRYAKAKISERSPQLGPRIQVEAAEEKQMSGNQPRASSAAAPQEVDAATSVSHAVSSRSNLSDSLADPASFEDFSDAFPESTVDVPKASTSAPDHASDANLPSRPSTPRPRPPLEQSQFSWMLGEEEDQPSNLSRRTSPIPTDQARNRSFLFGGDEHTAETHGSRGKGDQMGIDQAVEEEEFDMSSLRHGKK